MCRGINLGSATIKTHHNLALPQRMQQGQGLQLIEPLRELFKDEVRELGKELLIPHEIVMRHPFPGELTPLALLIMTGHRSWEVGNSRSLSPL